MRSDENGNLLDAINKNVYARPSIVNWYGKLDFLLKPEEMLLESLTPIIKDKKVLDIAIGGGRTTKYLLQITKDYTGIDYSPACVELAREKYPETDIRPCDARDLSPFQGERFDFVLFAFNGIDYVVHEDRLRVLKEIRRVLKPGGFLMFATHNRDYKHFNKLPWQEGIQWNLPYFKSCIYLLAHLPKHFAMKRHEVFTDEYAIINDTAHGFSLLAYYISVDKQVRQLERVGFVDIKAFDMDGNRITENDACPWIHFLTRKG